MAARSAAFRSRATMKVYAAINAVQRALSHTGIAKDRTNTQGSGYKFRGIDDVYNAIAPLLADHGLCILPRMISRICEERTSCRTLFSSGQNKVEVQRDFFVSSSNALEVNQYFNETRGFRNTRGCISFCDVVPAAKFSYKRGLG